MDFENYFVLSPSHRNGLTRMKLTAFIIAAVLFASCQQEKSKEMPVVQVFDYILYPSEIAEYLPSNITAEDSMVLSQNYITHWITQKLLLQKAIENLPEQQDNIQKRVENYWTSLMIHQYRQLLMAQRIKDNIDEEKIRDYYEKNGSNFILSTPIAKAVFFMLPKGAPNMKEVRKWFLSDKAEDQDKLEDYCLTNARKYDKFNDSWVEVNHLLNLINEEGSQLMKDIKTHKKIERKDSNFYYFLKINDWQADNTVAPLSYVREDIILILRNRTRLEFESELERQINEEARRKNFVKIF